MTIFSRIRDAIVGGVDFPVPTPRPFRAGTCPWCHRPWTQDDADVRMMIDPHTGKDVIVHACGWFVSSSDNPEGMSRWH